MFQVSISLGDWTAAFVVQKDQAEPAEEGSYPGPGIAAIIDPAFTDEGMGFSRG